MEVPKFLIADNSTLQDEIFVLHTEYPRFLLNVSNDEILWLEEFGKEDQDELEKITEEWSCRPRTIASCEGIIH